MTLSLYRASVPVYVQMLKAFSRILDKAAAHAEARKFDPAILLAARLAPDMWSLAEQIRAGAGWAVRSSARLAGLAIPQFDGKDATVADLKARIEWTVAFLEGVDPKALDGAGERPVTFPLGSVEHTMPGRQYFLTLALPNFYFHLTTAYDILRHNGVPLEKDDFIGAGL